MLARVLLAVMMATLLWSPRAQAQSTVTLTVNRVDRVAPFRQSREMWINYEECVANDVFTFPLQTNDTGPLLEVWAGNSNCAELRSSNDREQCWIVASVPANEDTFNVYVPVRNMVARRLNIDSPPENLPASVCDESRNPSGEKFTLYFILQEGGRSVGSMSWDAPPEGLGFDMVGPSPPRTISVGVGERQLTIGIDDVPEEEDRERFEAFCVPEGTMALPEEGEADAGTTDAGGDAAVSAASSAGVDAGGGAAPGGCYSPIIRSGVRPPLGFSCGEAGETSTRLRTSRLTNNITYAVGVSGQDAVGNAGVLSELQCGTPIELDDFYEVYSRNGGLGGGGFCALPRVPRAPSQAPFFVLGGLVALLGWRRARCSP
jgi:hypothetical protein